MIVLRRCRPAGLLAAEAAAVVALTIVGSRPPFSFPRHGLGQWLRTAAPADAVVAGARWVALAGAWWLLAGTALYVAASLTRLPAAVRAVRWAALPPVRRAVDVAFAVSVVTGTVLVAPSTTIARAATRDVPSSTVPVPAPVRSGHGSGLASLPADAALPPSTTLAPEPVATAPVGAPPRAPEFVMPAPRRAATIVVVPGDNLWDLAARQLAVASGRSRADVGDAEVAPYWVAVCEQNRATLASGDPNVIFPGEVVTLPAVS